jgi:hypothetical protein
MLQQSLNRSSCEIELSRFSVVPHNLRKPFVIPTLPEVTDSFVFWLDFDVIERTIEKRVNATKVQRCPAPPKAATGGHTSGHVMAHKLGGERAVLPVEMESIVLPTHLGVTGTFPFEREICRNREYFHILFRVNHYRPHISEPR